MFVTGVQTCALPISLTGIEGYAVDVETDISAGLTGMEIVGLAGTAVKESKERIRSAIKNSGMIYPAKRITVNLAPADTKKDGPTFDLALAVGILAASEQIVTKKYKEFVFLGELSLDGKLRGVCGVMPLLISAVQQRSEERRVGKECRSRWSPYH